MIRPAQLEDAAAIHGLHIASVRALARLHYGPEQIDAWCGRRSPASYREPIESKVVLVTEQGGKLAGFGQLNLVSATIEAVYVHPCCAGLGVGRVLLLALEEAAIARGLQGLWLDASLNAEAFYRRAGYLALAAIEHELAPGVTIPCVAMSKRLAPIPPAPARPR
jgi:GNAT superfamily N-acetyltransferase